MSSIDRIGNLFYVVDDMDVSVAFYQDKLGLSLRFRDGDRWAAFDVAGVTLALASAEEAAAVPGGGAIVSFRVADLETWMREASLRGVAPGPLEQGVREHRLRVTDPDGNRLVIYSRPPS